MIEGLLQQRVNLPSGGYLLIDYAEALTVIDVNSGSFTGKGKNARLEDTILKTNLEAAEAVVDELRLRDIGGIIVIDFIDMARARNRDAVLKTLRKSLEEDRTKTFTAEISKLGLVEMTRQNVTEGVREIMSRPCPTCDGEGIIKSEETIAIEFERKLRDIAKHADGTGRGVPRADEPARQRAVHRRPGPRAARARGGDGQVLPLHRARRACRSTTSTSCSPAGREEVAEKAIPWRDGDEVLVEIVEPHMYNVDDAVAKIDGYVISVTGAGPLVGSKRLVRLTEVGRTSATAVLLGDDGEPVEVAARRSTAAAATATAPSAAAAGAAGGAARPRRRPRSDPARRRRGRRAAAAPPARQPDVLVPVPQAHRGAARSLPLHRAGLPGLRALARRPRATASRRSSTRR